MPNTTTARGARWEVWMYLSERNRNSLIETMEQQGISRRELARAAGWSSHSYMNRLLNGEVSTLDPGAAVRIAAYLRVPVATFFVSKSTSPTSQRDRRELAKAG